MEYRSMTKLFYIFFLFPVLPLFANLESFPEIIDYGNFSSIDKGYYADFEEEAWKLGYYAFNYAPEITPFFALIKKNYSIDTVVETGTFLGGTTVLFSLLFENVITIEINDNYFQNAKEKLKSYSNVYCLQGSSEKVFHAILPNLKDRPILFYLDAHWKENWPLLEELKEISKTHKDNCIVVIDDFKVPNRNDIVYDVYDGIKECSLEYIKHELDQVFSSYQIHYLIPRSKNSKAKFVAIPKVWVKKN